MARERSDTERSWNLVPIMNLATLLIPVLLMGSQFVAVRLLDQETPDVRVENPGDDGVRAIALRVDVTRKGIRIIGAETVLAGPNGQPFLPCLGGDCANPGAYDYDSLQRLVGHVKDAYPWADEVEISASDWVPYEVLVRVNDAVAGDEENELFPRIRLIQ